MNDLKEQIIKMQEGIEGVKCKTEDAEQNAESAAWSRKQAARDVWRAEEQQLRVEEQQLMAKELPRREEGQTGENSL